MFNIKCVKTEIVIGNDEKERKLMWWEDGSIGYVEQRNGENFRSIRYIRNKKPKWMKGETWDYIEESRVEFSKVEHCERCGGYGIIPAYKHVDAGICFDCDGKQTNFNKRSEEIIDPAAEKRKEEERKAAEKELYELPLEIEKRKNALEAVRQVTDILDEDVEYCRVLKALIKEKEERRNELREFLGIKSYK